jgi:hypothetical protein
MLSTANKKAQENRAFEYALLRFIWMPCDLARRRQPVTDNPKVKLSGVKVVFERHKEVVKSRLSAKGDHKAAGNNQHTAHKYGI